MQYSIDYTQLITESPLLTLYNYIRRPTFLCNTQPIVTVQWRHRATFNTLNCVMFLYGVASASKKRSSQPNHELEGGLQRGA